MALVLPDRKTAQAPDLHPVTGIGLVFSTPAMTAANWKASIRQGNAGTDQTYENSATSLTTVLVSTSVPAANTDYMAIIEGFCQCR